MEKTTIEVIYHSRKKFYNGRNIYWYEFVEIDDQMLGGLWKYKYDGDKIPSKFLKVPETKYYEYGGSHEDAIKDLTNMGITDIVEGNEI